MTKPALNAIAPWFGGKRTLAPVIVQELGSHQAYFEPFCGSMAVLFAKDRSPHETVNDLHGDLINLAMVLASPLCPTLYEKLTRTTCCETIFEMAKNIFVRGKPTPPSSPAMVKPKHIERAYCYFLVSWMGRNGVSGTARQKYQMAIRWTHGGGGGGKRFVSATESIPAWHRRLREVTILNRDGFKLIEKIDDQEPIAIYVDPPYFPESCGSGEGSKGTRYEHDFADADHARLAEAVGRFKNARVVVSYYWDERLPELYPGWTIRKMFRQKHLHVQNKRGVGRNVAPEALLINGPSYAGREGLFA